MPSKITRLSPIDVVNTSALPSQKKRPHLEGLEIPRVYWGYAPVQKALPKLLLVSSDLFGSLPKDSDEAILAEIRRSCHRDDQESANIAVAESIIKWRNATGARGVLIRPEAFRSTTGTINFCADVAVVVEGELYVVNLDVRSKMNLSSGGKELMKSLIHHTALIGDLKTAKVAILRTPAVRPGSRKCELEVLEGQPIHSLEVVESAVLETYAIWELILMARRSESAKNAGGESGSLI